MFFSVSIPIYNAEEYLDRVINSVIMQTEQDFELILVNDGSKDNSLKICYSWKEKYPSKIKVIDKENNGSLLTRRRCIKESVGDFLYIIDADDYLIDCNALKEIRNIIETQKVDLVFFNCITDLLSRKKYFEFPEFKNNEIFEKENLIKLYKYFISNNGLKPLWNKIFSKKLVDFDCDYTNFKEITNGTDFFQSIPIVFNATKVLFFDYAPYYYNTNEKNSIVHTFKRTIYQSMKNSFLLFLKYHAKSKYQIANASTLLKTKFMQIVSTSVSKLKLAKLGPLQEIDAIAYLKSIREDKLFIQYYTLDGINIFRQIIVILMKYKHYRTLLIIIRIMKFLNL